eukprot:332664_1
MASLYSTECGLPAQATQIDSILNFSRIVFFFVIEQTLFLLSMSFSGKSKSSRKLSTSGCNNVTRNSVSHPSISDVLQMGRDKAINPTSYDDIQNRVRAKHMRSSKYNIPKRNCASTPLTNWNPLVIDVEPAVGILKAQQIACSSLYNIESDRMHDTSFTIYVLVLELQSRSIFKYCAI